MKKIGMVVAMDSELTSFLKSRDVEIKQEKKGPFFVSEFKIGENDAICVKSGVGEIFAAAATQFLISVYNPDIIINFGVCGSLTSDLGVEKVALVKGVVHYGFDTSAIDGVEVGRYVQFDDTVIYTDKELLKKAATASEEKLPEVICASADKFVADQDEKRRLVESYGASVCEMESAGVLITCKNAEKPCLIVKAVSDGDGGAEQFKEFVQTASEKYTSLIGKLCELL